MAESQPVAQLAQILLVESKFRHRIDPLTASPDQKVGPQRLRVEVNTTPFDENGVLGVRLALASDPEEEGALYDFDVVMAAVLTRNDATPKEWTERDFAKLGASMLFPFAREAVANVTSRGRFGTVWLNPFNMQELFEAGETAAKG